MLPAKFFLCSIVGSDGESLCGNISHFVGPTLAPKGHVIELVKPKMVAPYAWYRYHDGEPSGLMPLNANDTLLEFGAPELTHSVDHVIIWGWENGNQTATDEARSWFEAHADVFRGEARAAAASR